MSVKKPTKFSEFINLFPEEPLPILLDEDAHINIDRLRMPIPEKLVQFIIDDKQVDELQEFTPCFRLKETYSFHAVVYWTAHLKGHTFYLKTYTEDGEPIHELALAGMTYEDQTVNFRLASLEEGWIIYIAEGHITLI